MLGIELVVEERRHGAVRIGARKADQILAAGVIRRRRRQLGELALGPGPFVGQGSQQQQKIPQRRIRHVQQHAGAVEGEGLHGHGQVRDDFGDRGAEQRRYLTAPALIEAPAVEKVQADREPRRKLRLHKNQPVAGREFGPAGHLFHEIAAGIEHHHRRVAPRDVVERQRLDQLRLAPAGRRDDEGVFLAGLLREGRGMRQPVDLLQKAPVDFAQVRNPAREVRRPGAGFERLFERPAHGPGVFPRQLAVFRQLPGQPVEVPDGVQVGVEIHHPHLEMNLPGVGRERRLLVHPLLALERQRLDLVLFGGHCAEVDEGRGNGRKSLPCRGGRYPTTGASVKLCRGLGDGRGRRRLRRRRGPTRQPGLGYGEFFGCRGRPIVGHKKAQVTVKLTLSVVLR